MTLWLVISVSYMLNSWQPRNFNNYIGVIFIFQSEKIRWGQSIKSFEAQEKTLCGDVLLTAAFVSYVGSFTKQYRQELVECSWIPFLQRKVISLFGSIILKFKLGAGVFCSSTQEPWVYIWRYSFSLTNKSRPMDLRVQGPVVLGPSRATPDWCLGMSCLFVSQ